MTFYKTYITPFNDCGGKVKPVLDVEQVKKCFAGNLIQIESYIFRNLG
jgi:hypothetical protein